MAALGAIVSMLLVAILVQNTGLFYQQTSLVSQGLGLNDALENVRKKVKEAQVAEATSSAETLVLKIPAVDSSGNVIVDVFDVAIYTKEGDKLRYLFLPDSQSAKKSQDMLLTGRVNSVLFEYFDETNQQVLPQQAVKVKFSLTLETNVATTEARLRND